MDAATVLLLVYVWVFGASVGLIVGWRLHQRFIRWCDS